MSANCMLDVANTFVFTVKSLAGSYSRFLAACCKHILHMFAYLMQSVAFLSVIQQKKRCSEQRDSSFLWGLGVSGNDSCVDS